LLLGATDRVLGLTRRLAACFKDSRDPAYTEHAVETLVMQRVVGMALGYEDLNDHGQLRHDPVLATLANKLTASRSDCVPLAGKSTLNRLELSRDEPTRYARIAADGAAIEALFVDLFLDAHAQPEFAVHRHTAGINAIFQRAKLVAKVCVSQPRVPRNGM
jgi:Transposase DDE domain group 1